MKWLKFSFIVFVTTLLFGCEKDLCGNYIAWEQYEHAICEKKVKFNEPCLDTSTLVATTAGSPNQFSCSNKLHRMKVETKVIAGEEIGALVFCQCFKE
jgi:hypothetical protein